MPTVLIVDDDRNLTKMLDFAFQRAGYSVMIARDGTEGLTMANGRPPDVAILDVMMPGVHGYELCRLLREDAKTSRVRIVFLTARTQPIDQQEGLRAGADLFLSKPVMPDDLVQRVEALLAEESEIPMLAAAPESAVTQAVPAPATTQEQVVAPAPAEARQGRPAVSRTSKGRLIVCIGGCSGVGVTTLAANLSLGFALSRRAETPLVELHASPGNLLPALGLVPGPPCGDLVATGTILNWEVLTLHLMDHPSGVRVLPAPPAEADVPPALTGRAVDILRNRFPLVVADAWSRIDERVQAVLLAADVVLVITTPEPPAARATWELSQKLQGLGYPKRQLLLIVNNVQPRGSVSLDKIRAGIRLPLLATVPYEPSMQVMFDIGKPVILSQPRSPVATAVGRIVTQLSHGLS